MLSQLRSFIWNKKRVNAKIGVLYICTGKYSIYWPKFYLSAKKYFCPGAELHFFVFSDSSLDNFNDPKVHYYHQEKLGWPYDTLRRFHIFLSQKEQLQKMEFLYYFNANMIFKKTVAGEEILPDVNHFPSGLVSVVHPCHYNRAAADLIYDRTPNSTACVPAGEGAKYYQGCLSGGTSEAYLTMCEILKKNIDKDEQNGIIALWHDESHINHYFISHPPKELHPGYAYPENMKVPFSKIIVQLDKTKAGGHEFLRS